ncbi:uncharacterized protein DS421_14g476660 [Arachis hypogaea]|nr:uncharacterized protein DS421_14g476660 [Arachis hypogaea]
MPCFMPGASLRPTATAAGTKWSVFSLASSLASSLTSSLASTARLFFFLSLRGRASIFASCELLSISSLLELEGDSEAIEDYLGENAPTLTTANLKAFVNKQMKSEKEASWTNMEGAQSVDGGGAFSMEEIHGAHESQTVLMDVE